MSAESQKLRRAQRRREGLCAYCGAPTNGHSLCEPHLKRERDRQAGRYASLPKRAGRERARTLAPKRLTKDEERQRILLPVVVDPDRPRRRGDCEGGARPCPYVSCRYHLFLDVSESGGLKLNYPDREVDQLVESCSLDVADKGGVTLDEVGGILGIVRERVRQIEVIALVKLNGMGAGR